MRSIDLSALFLKALSSLTAVLMPIRPALAAVFCLIGLDLITGLWASKKKGDKITSQGMRDSIKKLLVYEGALLGALIIETYLLPDIPLIKAVTGYIGLIEGKSFFENLHAITGVDFWAQIIPKLTPPSEPKDESSKQDDKK